MSAAPPPAHVAYVTPTPISNVIVILQQGRSLNNLFADCAPAGIQHLTKTGQNHTGGSVSIVAGSLVALGNPQHTYTQQLVADNCTGTVCAMNGFDLLTLTGGTGNTAYSYIPASQVNASPFGYCTLATTYATSDATYAPAKISVMPSYLYAIAGQSGGFTGSHLALTNNHLGSLANTGCATPEDVGYVDMTQPFPTTEQDGPNNSCLTMDTIFTRLDSAGVSWKYYCNDKQNRACTPTNISAIYNGSDYTNNVITPETTVKTDCTNGTLPAVAFVTPNLDTISGTDNSDDAFEQGTPACNFDTSMCPGPAWVNDILTACGPSSQYWGKEVIFLVWVNGGNWYDSQPFPFASYSAASVGNPNPLEYGQRIPLIAISPFARPGYVDHTPRTFVSILRFIETVYNGLPTLGTLDAYEPDDMTQFFDWSRNRHWL